MKSIKEKAKEHGLDYPGIRCSNDDIYKDCDKPSMDFVAGANYVVEEIEKLVKTTIGDGGTYHYNLYISKFA